MALACIGGLPCPGRSAAADLDPARDFITSRARHGAGSASTSLLHLASSSLFLFEDVAGLLSDARRFALAGRRRRREHSLPSLLHLATSGLFLAEDVARLW